MPGLPELLIVLVVILLVFGPKRLPGIGRQLGGGMREFKDAITRKGGADDEEPTDEPADASPVPPRPELTRAQQADVLDPQRPSTGARDESATRSGG